MFGKDWQSRWNDTIAYLNTAASTRRLGDEIEAVVTNQDKRKSISKELSLGSRPDGEDDAGYAGNTDQRHALRALLMCQRVYFGGDTWARVSEAYGANPGVVQDDSGLVLNWKTHSLNHWRTKSKAQIHQGIRMFEIVDGVTGDDLAEAAQNRPNGVALPGNLTLSRDTQAVIGFGVICYVGVQGWLVRSGLVSMRWFMRNSSPNGEIGCDGLFGKGVRVWEGPIAGNDEAQVQRICANVARGSIVHIWSPDNYNWNGHWVVANGDGTICGVNNGEIPARNIRKDYTNKSTLYEQFRGYSNAYEHQGAQRTTTAIMSVINPMTMPRM